MWLQGLGGRIKQKKCITRCWASRWFLLFYSPKPCSQVWILIYRNWPIIILRSRTTITVKERGTKTKKTGLLFLSLKNKQPQVSLNLSGMRKKGRGGGKKKRKFLLSPIPSPFFLLSPSPSDVGIRSLRRDVFERRTSTGSGLFLTLRPWFWTNSWANRLYKSKDTRQYKFGSAKAY